MSGKNPRSEAPRAGLWICLAVALCLAALSAVAYPHMASEIVTRAADGRHGESSPSREMTAVLIPVVLALLGAGVYLGVTRAPNLWDRVIPRTGTATEGRTSARVMNVVLGLIAVLLGVMHLSLLAWYMGLPFSMEKVMGSVAGLVLMGIGVVLPLARGEGEYHAPAMERYRAGASVAYRPAGMALVVLGVIAIVLSWTFPLAAPLITGAGIFVVFAFIIGRGLYRASNAPRA